MNRKRFLIYVFMFLMLLSCIFPFYCYGVANPSIQAPTCLLMEAKTGKIIYEKNAYEKMFPASTTKIMTAILALEHRNLSDTAVVSSNAISTVPQGYSHANLQPDEILTIEQLLYALLLPSANDAANVIAEDIGGSIESFANMMNTKAKEIGCEDTHFVNPNGVHDENHYSTAYDLALMGRYAIKNEIFAKIVATARYTLPSTNRYDKEDRIFITTNRLVNNKSGQYYEYATGIKTGFTDPAKNCIVASAIKNNVELIGVIMGADGDTDTTVNKFADCISLFQFGFENYQYKTLCSAGSVFKVISPKNASKDTPNLDVLYENDIMALVKTENVVEDFPKEVELNPNLSAPIVKGEVIGKISYSIDGINYTTNLTAGQDILESPFISFVFKIVLLLFALYLLRCIWHFLHKGKKKKKKAKHKKRNKKKHSHSSLYHFDL